MRTRDIRDRRVYLSGNYEPEPRVVTSKKMYCLVDRKHKLVYHKDGHILLFSRRKDADEWLIDQDTPKDWRVMIYDVHITTR